MTKATSLHTMIFRLILIIYVISLATVLIKIFFLGLGQLPEAALVYLQWWYQQPLSSIEQTTGWISLVAGISSIAGAIAMLFFMNWARALFAISILVLVATEAVLDLPVLITSIEAFLDSICSILAGGIIVFSYFTNLTNRFSK